MVRRALRLSAKDIEGVLSKGRSYQGALVRGKALPRPTATSSRFAVIVSKKTAKMAVERNLLRRQVFSILASESSPRIPSDVVLFVGAKADFSKLQTAVHEVLSRLQ